MARASVNTKARLSSSLSPDNNTIVFGSLASRDSCGCTSELPRPMINRRAVLSTLQKYIYTPFRILRPAPTAKHEIFAWKKFSRVSQWTITCKFITRFFLMVSQILWKISVHFNVVHWRNPRLKSLNSMPARCRVAGLTTRDEAGSGLCEGRRRACEDG